MRRARSASVVERGTESALLTVTAKNPHRERDDNEHVSTCCECGLIYTTKRQAFRCICLTTSLCSPNILVKNVPG